MHLFLSPFLIGLLQLLFVNEQVDTSKMPLIIAHRGASFHAPENTVASAKLGWQHQAEAVEIDIHLSSDHKIMVMHDEGTKRTTGADFTISTTSSDVLRTLDAGSWKGEAYKGEKIPFLNEILQVIPSGKKLFIEIKGTGDDVPFLKQEIERSGKMDQCVIISFDFPALVAAKNALPQVPVLFLSSKINPEAFPGLLSDIRSNKIDGLDLYFPAITPELAQWCKQNSIALYAWTVDDVEVARKLISLGVKGITTNQPLELREKLSRPPTGN